MIEWWDGLSGVLKILYCIAVPATLVLVIQTILSLHGGFEGGAGVDVSDTSGLDFQDGSDLGDLTDAGGDNAFGDGGNPADFTIMSMLTLQGIATFMTVMGWSSIVAVGSGTPVLLSVLVGIVLGFLAMYAAARIMHTSRRLAENGTLDLRNAIGEVGRVYLPIPPKGKGAGKITLQVQGRYVECSAMSLGSKTLHTGEVVRVTDVRNDILTIEEME